MNFEGQNLAEPKGFLKAILCVWTLLLALLFPQAVLAQEQYSVINQTALSSPWSGQIDWTEDQSKKEASIISLPSQDDSILVEFRVEDCKYHAREIKRFKNGTVAMSVTEDSCGTNAKTMTLTPVSKGELGVTITAGITLVGLAHLTPSTAGMDTAEKKWDERKFDATQIPHLPTTLNEHYLVTRSGSVLKIAQEEKRLELFIVARDQWMIDEGSNVGDRYFIGQYNSRGGDLWLQPKVMILPDQRENYRHCGPIFGYKKTFQLNILNREFDLKRAKRTYKSVPKQEKSCSVLRTSRTSCRVTSCEEYKPNADDHHIIMKSRATALKLGERARQHVHIAMSLAMFLANLSPFSPRARGVALK